MVAEKAAALCGEAKRNMQALPLPIETSFVILGESLDRVSQRTLGKFHRGSTDIDLLISQL